MSSSVINSTRPLLKKVTPVLSADREEARKRVLHLWKLWYRQSPYVVMDYDVPLTTKQVRNRVREEIEKNRQINDIRAIDMLVIKGQMDLVETAEIWKQRNHIMDYFRKTPSQLPKKDFLANFFEKK